MDSIISGFEAEPLYVNIMSHYYLYWITSKDWTIQCKLDAQVDFPPWPAPASAPTVPCILCPRSALSSGLATVAAALLGSLYPCLDSTCIPPVRVHNRYHSVHMYDIPHTLGEKNSYREFFCWKVFFSLAVWKKLHQSPQLMISGPKWRWLSWFEECFAMQHDKNFSSLLWQVLQWTEQWCHVLIEESVSCKCDSKHAGLGKSLLLWGSKTNWSIFISKVKYHMETINKIVAIFIETIYCLYKFVIWYVW